MSRNRTSDTASDTAPAQESAPAPRADVLRRFAAHLTDWLRGRSLGLTFIAAPSSSGWETLDVPHPVGAVVFHDTLSSSTPAAGEAVQAHIGLIFLAGASGHPAAEYLQAFSQQLGEMRYSEKGVALRLETGGLQHAYSDKERDVFVVTASVLPAPLPSEEGAAA